MRRILLVGAVLTGIWGGITGLNILLVQPEGWSRFDLNLFNHREQPIDYLWLGSSHVYRDINPDIMDELTGKRNFNLSTASQNFSQSFLLLQEADEKFELEHVYLEMYFRIHLREHEQEYYSLEDQFWVWDYLPNSRAKQQMIRNYDPEEELPAVYMPFVRYRKYIFDSDHISACLNENLNVEYKESIGWQKNGYGKADSALGMRNCVMDNGISQTEEEILSETAENYLVQIIKYCQANGIELTLFSSPVPDLFILKEVQDYDSYVGQIREIAEEYSLNYYDFNLCKEEKLPVQGADFYNYYNDKDHLNDAGVTLFTSVLGDVVMNDRTDYFYDSYEQKLKQTPPSLYGLIRNGINENGEMQYELASNREQGVEYRIEFVPDKRDYEGGVVQEYCENKHFVYKSEYEGVFLISARIKGEENPFVEMTIGK